MCSGNVVERAEEDMVLTIKKGHGVFRAVFLRANAAQAQCAIAYIHYFFHQ
jgi:hypothetical protein